MMKLEALLPPGFRFHPTDEELILHYLRNRAASLPCPISVIAEVDIYKFDPWDLPAKAMYGDREWYFFSPRDRKYPNGVRPNRAAGSGYWKATGTDKVIVATPGNENIGVKKALVFYRGRPLKGSKTNWIMHEYRLAQTRHGAAAHIRPMKQPRESSSMRLDDWVLCRIYKKCSNFSGSPSDLDHEDYNVAEGVAFSPVPGTAGGSAAKLPKTLSFGDLLDDGDYSVLARLLDEDTPDMASPEFGSLLGHHPAMNQTCLDSDGHTSFSLPNLSPMESPASEAGSCLKRQRTAVDDAGEGGAATLRQPKGSSGSSCSNYTSFTTQLDTSTPQCSLLSPPFLHQQILLNSHFGLR